MRLLSAILLPCLLLLFAAAWWLLAAEEPVPPPATGTPSPAPGLAEQAPDSAAATALSAPPVAVADAPPRATVDTRDWQSGIVRGDVQLAIAALAQLESISVVVEELRQAIAQDGSFQHPHRIVVPVKMGAGTPTFEVRDIPFSDYPYEVRLYSPGLNGSSRTLVINRETPLHEDVVLAITPGAPFTLLLRDQDQDPLTAVDVRLVPQGNPPGRPPLQGTSDNFGAVVWDSVLAGDYQLRLAKDGVPLDESQLLTVDAGQRYYGTRVQGQGHVVTIARGEPLLVQVTAGPYGLPGAQVRLQPTDRLRVMPLEATTDHAGNASFPRLQPGIWQVDVWLANYERRTRQITIKSGEAPPALHIPMVRLR